MRICVQGLWHLGSVTAACLASLGHEVVGFDADRSIITSLNAGKAPIFEPDLNSLIEEGIRGGMLRFTSSIENACTNTDALWVTFDTPVNNNDEADINFVLNQVKTALMFLSDGSLLIVSSQLPVGSIAVLENYVKEIAPKKRIIFASVPENLRLGKALNVFLNPDRIIVGIRSQDDRLSLEKLLLTISNNIEWMSVESAEMTKHAINSFLATSITFANEIANICELVGADAKEVEIGLKSESRIGPKAYLSPGGAFAGGTLARDIEFLGKISKDRRLVTPLLSSIRLSNDSHKKWVQRKLIEHFLDLKDINVAIWGLTYKAGTDTLRRSLTVELVEWLLERGANVSIYDPAVKELPIKWNNRVKKSINACENLEQMQVLVVGTELPEFKEEARKILELERNNLLIIDANRHLLESIKDGPFEYVAVGYRNSYKD